VVLAQDVHGAVEQHSLDERGARLGDAVVLDEGFAEDGAAAGDERGGHASAAAVPPSGVIRDAKDFEDLFGLVSGC